MFWVYIVWGEAQSSTLVISYGFFQLLTKQKKEAGTHIYHLPGFQKQGVC